MREGHRHNDWGSFQMVRKSRWLSRETVSYDEAIVGWNNVPGGDAGEGVGHNMILFAGQGPPGDPDRRPDGGAAREPPELLVHRGRPDRVVPDQPGAKAGP